VGSGGPLLPPGLAGYPRLLLTLRAQARTRQFARRQRMWFRRDPRITWLGATDNHCAVLPALLATWSS